MLGLLVIIIVSWMLLYFIEKKNIAVLGIFPVKKRIIQFVIGFVIIAITILFSIYIETLIFNIDWKLNTVNYTTIFSALLYHFKSALTEDLVFRGAILYILIQRIGAKKALFLSAFIFGIYHWFSYGILNERVILLVYVLIMTGFTGYVWAYTFNKTKSVMMGLGFHLGYNFIMSCFFEAQPYGEMLFTQIAKQNLSEWNGFLFSLFKGLFPSIITLIFVKQYIKT